MRYSNKLSLYKRAASVLRGHIQIQYKEQEPRPVRKKATKELMGCFKLTRYRKVADQTGKDKILGELGVYKVT